MYLKVAVEKEIIEIVKKYKTKLSADRNDTDAKLIKKAINEISKSLYHIFNLSFQIGRFPNSMKTATIPTAALNW